MSKDDSSHKRVFLGFCISKPRNLFCFVLIWGREINIGLTIFFILPSTDILITLSSPSLSFHKIIDPLAPIKKEGYDHRIRDSLIGWGSQLYIIESPSSQFKHKTMYYRIQIVHRIIGKAEGTDCKQHLPKPHYRTMPPRKLASHEDSAIAAGSWTTSVPQNKQQPHAI